MPGGISAQQQQNNPNPGPGQKTTASEPAPRKRVMKAEVVDKVLSNRVSKRIERFKRLHPGVPEKRLAQFSARAAQFVQDKSSAKGFNVSAFDKHRQAVIGGMQQHLSQAPKPKAAPMATNPKPKPKPKPEPMHDREKKETRVDD